MSVFGSPVGPLVLLGGGGVLLLLLDLFWEGRQGLLRGVALLVLASAAIAAIVMPGGMEAFSGAIRADSLARATDLLAIAGAVAAILLPAAVDGSAEGGWGKRAAAYLALVLWATAGMSLVGGAGNLIVLFVGIEVLSLGLYVLCAFALGSGIGAEAAFKYFVLGGLGSGLLLYGSALTYAATGSLTWAAIAATPAGLLGGMGLVLIIAGLGFKLALAPFQLWTPDVYQGAPTPVAAFMAVGTKAAAFAALARVLFSAFGFDPRWIAVVAVLGVLSMLVGYLGAGVQPGAKRFLAYSGIANAGALLLVLLVPSEAAPLGFLFLAAYAASSLGVFAVLSAIQGPGVAGDDIGRFAGIRRHPLLAVALLVALLSLAGVPPTGGFAAKLLLLRGLVLAGHPAVAIALVVASIVGLYPYFRWVMSAFAGPEEGAALTPAVPRIGWGVVAGCSAVLTLLVGILPGIVLHG